VPPVTSFVSNEGPTHAGEAIGDTIALSVSPCSTYDYFAPLKKWLDEQNQGRPVGWQ